MLWPDPTELKMGEPLMQSSINPREAARLAGHRTAQASRGPARHEHGGEGGLWCTCPALTSRLAAEAELSSEVSSFAGADLSRAPSSAIR